MYCSSWSNLPLKIVNTTLLYMAQVGTIGYDTIGVTLTSNNRIGLPKNKYYLYVCQFGFRSAGTTLTKLYAGLSRWRDSTEGSTHWVKDNFYDSTNYCFSTQSRIIYTSASSSQSFIVTPAIDKTSGNANLEFYQCFLSFIQLS